MKKIKFILLLFLLIPFSINAEDVEYTLFNSNIKVNTDRTLDINEDYKIYYIENVDKVTRKIEIDQMIIRPNKSKTTLSTLISNINSSTPYTLKKEKNTQKIILDTNGSQDSVGNYSISYKYNLGKDILKNSDELFYKIVNNIDAPISNFTFTVEFPKEIDKKNVKFAINGNYNLTSDDITYEVNGNILTGTLNILLSNNQSFAIYVELPDGYFVGATDNFNYMNYLYILFPIVGCIIIFIFFIKYGKGIKLKITRKSEILNDFDSAEIGYLYKGKLEEMDLTSLIVFLATKGYLKIVEHDDGYKLGKENSFHFVKLKDYDKNNAAQEIIFNELFRDRTKTELKDIEYHFASTFKEALDMLNNEDNHKKIFFESLKRIKLFSMILIILSIFLNNYKSIYLFTNSYLLVLPIIFIMIFGLYIVFLSNSNGLLKTIVAFIFLSGSLYIGIMPIVTHQHFLTIYIVNSLLILIMCILFVKLSDRTKYGSFVLSEIYGFKYYLESISKAELEQRISENSNYYFDMVPYAYVLDSIEIWINKGKDIITQPPSWYIPSSEFDLKKFEKFIKNLIYTTSLSMMKQVYSDSELITYTNDKVKTNLND